MYVISKYRYLRNISERVGERFLEKEKEKDAMRKC